MEQKNNSQFQMPVQIERKNVINKNPLLNVPVQQPQKQLRPEQMAISKFAESKRRTREKEIDEIYNTIMPEVNKDNYIRYEVFKKYEELYDYSNRQDLLNNTLPREEMERLAILSLELTNMINVYKPTHVVDDEGKEVFPTLPPLQMKLRGFDGKANSIIDRLNHYYAENGPIAQRQQEAITEELSRSLAACQDRPTVLKHMTEFDEMADKFHREVLNQYIYETKQNPQVSRQSVAKPEAKSNNTDFFDYDE